MGDIVVQRRVPVGDDDTATDLFHKTIVLFAPITLEALALIGSGRTDWIKQDPAQATFFHKRSAEDSRVFRREGGGVAIVCGPHSQAGTEQAIVLRRLRTDDGREHTGADFFRQMGGYLTSHPRA